MNRLYKYNLSLFLIVIVFIFLEICGEIGMALLFGKIVDVTTNKDTGQLLKLTYFTIVFVIATTLIFWLSKVLQKKYIVSSINSLRKSIFKKYLEQSNKQFYKEDIGIKISTLTNDMNILEVDFYQSTLLIIKAIVLFLGAIVIIVSTSYQIGLFLVCSSMLALFLPKIIGKNLQTYKIQFSDAQAAATARISEYLHGFSTISAFSIQKVISKNFDSNLNNIEKTALKYEKHYDFVRALSLILGSISFMGCMIYGVFLVTADVLTIGALITCIQMSNHITSPVYTLVDRISSLKSVKKYLLK